MDDDLMSLRGDDPGDDDLFGGFDDSPDDFDFDFGSLDEADATTMEETLSGSSTATNVGSDDDVPDWMRELDQPESLRATQPAATVAASRTPAPERRERMRQPSSTTSSRSGGGSGLGLSPMQRMVLSIFLFLDVAVIGFGLLIGLNIIAF